MLGGAGWKNGSRSTAIHGMPTSILSTGSNVSRLRKHATTSSASWKICKCIAPYSQTAAEPKPSAIQRCRSKVLAKHTRLHRRTFASVNARGGGTPAGPHPHGYPATDPRRLRDHTPPQGRRGVEWDPDHRRHLVRLGRGCRQGTCRGLRRLHFLALQPASVAGEGP